MRVFYCLAVTSMLLAVPLFAVVADEPAIEEPGAIEVCREMSLIAQEVMKFRQGDRPMSEALLRARDRLQEWLESFEINTTTEETEAVAEAMAAAMVMDAYKAHISTPPFQPEAITEFENEVFEGCYVEWTSDSEE